MPDKTDTTHPYYGVPRTRSTRTGGDTADGFIPSHSRHVDGYDPNRPGSKPETAGVDATATPPPRYDDNRISEELLGSVDEDTVEKNKQNLQDSYSLVARNDDAAYEDSRRAFKPGSTRSMSPREVEDELKELGDISLSERSYRSMYADTSGSSVGAAYAGDNAYTIGGLTDDADFDPSIIDREKDVNRQCAYLGIPGAVARAGSAKPYTFDDTAAALNKAVTSLLDMREEIIATVDGGSSTIKKKLAQATKVLAQALEYYASSAGLQELAHALEAVAQPANTAVMGINTAGLGFVQEYEMAAPVIEKLHKSGKNPAGIPGIKPNDVVDELVTTALQAGIDAGNQADDVLSDAVPVAKKAANVTVDATTSNAEISTHTSSGSTTKAQSVGTSGGGGGMAPRVVGGGGGGSMATPMSPGQLPTRRVGSRRGRGGSSGGRAGGSVKPNESGVSIPAEGTFTSGFGQRWGSPHNGIDIANEIGTPIYAVMDGTVINSGPASGFGNWIRIQHEDGSISVYGHMQADMLYVSEGEQVKSGQNIAGIGSEGQSTGPHLHFEIHPAGGSAIDPVPWFAEYGISI